MTKVNATLWSRSNKDGKFSIKIRITKDRNSKYIDTDYSVKESEWNIKERRARSAPLLDHVSINKRIDNLIKKAKNICHDFEEDEKEYTVQNVIDKIEGKNPKSFLVYCDSKIEQLKLSGSLVVIKRLNVW